MPTVTLEWLTKTTPSGECLTVPRTAGTDGISFEAAGSVADFAVERLAAAEGLPSAGSDAGVWAGITPVLPRRVAATAGSLADVVVLPCCPIAAGKAAGAGAR